MVSYLTCVHKCHKISFKRGGLYIDSFDWIKSKKATINFINKKDAFNTVQQSH